MVAFAPGRATIPNAEQVARLWVECDVPAHIRRHSEQVARLAVRLTCALREAGHPALDVGLVETAALLHDVAKAKCLATLGDHAADGARLVRERGFSAVAELVARHVELGPWDPDGEPCEAEILNYCDKRVQHERVVGLDERFGDLIERYAAGNPRAESRIRRNWSVTRALERKLFRELPFGPAELDRAGPKEEDREASRGAVRESAKD